MLNPGQEFHIVDLPRFKLLMLSWANRFNIFCFLDGNGYTPGEAAFDFCLAADSHEVFLTGPESISLSRIPTNGIFGHLAFECFDQNPKVISEPFVDFGKSFFFEPEHLLRVKNNSLFIASYSIPPQTIFDEIISSQPIVPPDAYDIQFRHALSRDEYLNCVHGLLKHIQRGDCYEINFCQHFFAEQISIEPLWVYANLCQVSPNPFSVFYRLHHKYCLCASPERFLNKTGTTLLSEPIKGTMKRSTDPIEDTALRNALSESLKDKTENVMTVDLVRNDLSIICEEGSVEVPSLFAIKSFPKVHHLVSTITGSINAAVDFPDIMHACFPMGSMTGAPKKRVLELIKEFEKEPRGLFSGSIGYITPAGNFDFNVVIRSLMYDDEKKLLSLKTGGGITANSLPEDEYEESLLKAEAGMQVVNKPY